MLHYIGQERSEDETTGDVKVVQLNVSENGRAMMRGLLEQVAKVAVEDHHYTRCYYLPYPLLPFTLTPIYLSISTRTYPIIR